MWPGGVDVKVERDANAIRARRLRRLGQSERTLDTRRVKGLVEGAREAHDLGFDRAGQREAGVREEVRSSVERRHAEQVTEPSGVRVGGALHDSVCVQCAVVSRKIVTSFS
jgi:hypothetical protein